VVAIHAPDSSRFSNRIIVWPDSEAGEVAAKYVFHIAVDCHGHAAGYFEIVEQHYAEGAQTPTKCPSSKITFSAKRA
jgi:hypothetical protein